MNDTAIASDTRPTVLRQLAASSATSLYVIGGQQRHLRPLRAGAGDWYEYQQGMILRIDPASQQADVLLEYISPPESCAAENPIILFKSCTLHENRLYACTQTEVLIYALPSFELAGYISLPCFNDLHHIRPMPSGNLLIANTGLDMVLELTPAGDVTRIWNVLGEPPWARFSPAIDYRKGVSTKPHRAHPNHIFCVDDEIWVTRFQQKDALCLTKPARRIAIEIERPHDGVLHNGLLYFTTVDGHVVIANPRTLRIEQIIDLQAAHDDQAQLGWCRGILVNGRTAWVGFSRLRPTKFRENVSWVKNGFKPARPTHLALYDLVDQRCLAEIDVEAYGLNAIFSILPVL
jgi:hypothetical protein